jgi:outer membrane protein assembly factor BamB
VDRSYTQSDMVDFCCPECGELYHYRADAIGKRKRCHNVSCGARFTVTADANVVPAPEEAPPMASVVPAPSEELPIANVVPAPSPDAADAPSAPDAAAEIPEEDEPPPEFVAAATASVDAPPGDESQSGPDEPPPEFVAASAAAAVPDDAIPTLPRNAITQQPEQFDDVPPVQLPVSDTVADAGGEDAGIEMLPATAVVAAATEREAQRPARRGPRRRPVGVLVVSACVLAVAGAAVIHYFTRPVPPDAEAVWAGIQEDYQLGKWRRAKDRFEKFPAEFADSPRVAEVPFFLDMCQAGPHTGRAGNPAVGLEMTDEIFQKYRDEQVYDDYCSDIYMNLVKLKDRFLEVARKADSLEHIELARRAWELISTVYEALPDDWRGQTPPEMAAEIDRAEKSVRLALSAVEASKLIDLLRTEQPGFDADPVYVQLHAVLEKYPDLANDSQLQSRLAAAYEAEPRRVRYVPEDVTSNPPAGSGAKSDQRHEHTLFLVWDDSGADSPRLGERVVVALVRGVLYAFDAGGRCLWARRLGIDSHRLPVSVDASPGSPAAVIAVSTKDNTLVALEKRSGRVLWRYETGGGRGLSAPLTIVSGTSGDGQKRTRGLLPTAAGEIHVLELVLGRRLGRYELGYSYPMTVGGVYDPNTKLAYFPADRKRVYAIDPAAIDDPKQPACPSVLLTDHPSGSLRSQPVVVGEYLILVEAAELDRTTVRAYAIGESDGFRTATDPVLAQERLSGWSWFTPSCTPDRITVATDEGVLGVFGLNLDNRQEALYPLIQDEDEAIPSLQIDDPYRALAIHSDEHLLWLMAGGKLRKIALNVLYQQWRVLAWPPPGEDKVFGIPVHEAQKDRWAEVFYLATMSARGHQYRFVAVNANSGRTLWQRQLGISLAGDPFPAAGGVVLIDQAGRIVQLDPKAVPEDRLIRAGAEDSQLPQGSAAGHLMRLRGTLGQPFLLVPLIGQRAIAIREIGPDKLSESDWLELQLPAELRGRPALGSEFLVAPCADGRLHRVRMDGAPRDLANEVTFQWSASQRPASDETAEVYPLEGPQVLLIDGRRRARQLEFRISDRVRQWVQIGPAFTAPNSLVGEPLTTQSYALLADSGGTIFRMPLDGKSRSAPQWKLQTEITTAYLIPQARCLIAVTADNRVACLVPNQPEPRWISEPFEGRICGQPQPLDDTLLVADESGHVAGIGIDDGQRRWHASLNVEANPSATPVAFGDQRMLVPIADGTLLDLPIPQPSEDEAGEVAQ